MKGITFLFCFATFMCIKNVRAKLQVDYLDGSKSRLDLQPPSAGYLSSGILRAHGVFSYPSNTNRTINVSAPPNYGLVVSISLIDLRPLKEDKLTIYTRNTIPVRVVEYTNSNFFKNRRYYEREDLTFYAPNGQIGITFTAGSSFSSTYGYDGFELVYTAVGDGIFCGLYDFRCNNGRCIAKELVCDGHNHCGNFRSLDNCPRYINPGRKIGISIGVGFLLVAAACGIFIAVRRGRRGATNTHTIVTSHPPPPTNLPSYPPAYPQPGTYYPPPPPPYSQGVVNPTYH